MGGTNKKQSQHQVQVAALSGLSQSRISVNTDSGNHGNKWNKSKWQTKAYRNTNQVQRGGHLGKAWDHVSGLRPLEYRVPRRAPPQTLGPTGDRECPYVFMTTSVVPGSGAAGHSASGPFSRPRWPGPQVPWCQRPQGP